MDTSNFGQSPFSRDQVLVAYAAEMIARTSLTQDDFAQALSAALHRMTPAKAAAKDVPDLVALHGQDDTAAFLRASGAWLRRVRRWLSGEIDLPCWLEEAWVQALSGEYRERCINELAGRYGLNGARALDAAACPVGVFGQLVARLGQSVELGSEILADGQIGVEDAPLLPEFIARLASTEARCCELRTRAEAVLAERAVAMAVAGKGAVRAVSSVARRAQA